MRSAEIPCGTTSYFARSFSFNAPMSDPIGTRVIDSTPPAITTSEVSVRTSIAPKFTACWPDPHWRFTLVPGTVSGKPATRAAMRAMFVPCSSVCVTHPRTTSSTRAGLIPVRSVIARRTCAAKSSGRTSFRAPPRFPRGVRTASTITAFAMIVSISSSGDGNKKLRQ